MRIAIIDDTPDCVENLERMVREAGYVPIIGSVASLDEAVASIQGVDVVLLDHKLGQFTGADVAMRLAPSVVIISTSSSDTPYTKKVLGGKDYTGRNSEEFFAGAAARLKGLIS